MILNLNRLNRYFNMPRISTYQPEIHRSGTVESTNQRNIQQIFSILNYLHNELDDKLIKIFGNINVFFTPQLILFGRADGTIAQDADFSWNSTLKVLTINGNTINHGNLTVNTIPAAAIDVDRFLVSNGGLVSYRTGTQLMQDIGQLHIQTLDPVNNVINTTNWATGDIVVLKLDALTGSFAVTLPSSVTVKRVKIHLKKIDATANDIQINPAVGEKIDDYV